MVLWSLGVAFFGVFFAVPLRKQTIIREKLRFPSGTATAEMISLLHQQNTSSSPSEISLRRRRYHEPVENDEDSPLLPSPASNPSTPPPAPLPESMHSSTNSLHSSLNAVDHERNWTLKLYALGISFSVSSLYTLLSYFFPIIYNLPLFNWLTFNFVDFVSWEWYFTPSFSYIGQGIIMVSAIR